MAILDTTTLSKNHRVRLGLVGFGNFGQLHAATIFSLDECELVAIVEPLSSTRSLAEQLYPSAKHFGELSAALDQSAVDGWIVASSTDSHCLMAKQILQRGGRVLVEKPLANTLAEAQSIEAFVRPDSTNLMMGHIVLFGSEFRALTQQALERSAIRYINTVRHRPASTMIDYPGETPLHLTMVHDLYCVQVLKQRQEPTFMSAQCLTNAEGQVTLATAQLLWPDGTMASLTASFLTPTSMGGGGFDRMEVFGDDWMCRIESNPRPIQLWDQISFQHPLTLEIQQGEHYVTGMLAEELRCYCRILRGEMKVPIGTSYSDALQIQRWLETLSKSVRA